MKPQEVVFFTAALLGAALCHCNEDTQMVSFNASGCIEEDSVALTRAQLYTTYSSADFTGLSCVAWGPGDGEGILKIDVIHLRGGCSSKYRANADVSDNRIMLTVKDTYEGIPPPCAGCYYDWSFEVEGVDPASAAPLTIRIIGSHGDSRSIEGPEIQASTPKGLRCRYTYGPEEDESSYGYLYHPCITSASDTDQSWCYDNLVCADSGGDNSFPICLYPCETTCPLDEMLTCDEGACKIADPWS